MNAVPPWAQIDTHHIVGASLRQAGHRRSSTVSPLSTRTRALRGRAVKLSLNQSLHDWWRSLTTRMSKYTL